MRRNFAIALTVAALTAGVLWAQASRTAEVQFKAAQQKELVEGDLKGAIKEYEKIAKGKDRALAAQALLRMAECYVKLGDADANKVYQRLIREFADQTAAVSVARARLGGATQAASAGLSRRLIPVPGPTSALPFAVSPDGRYLAYNNSNQPLVREILVRDLTTGSVRPVTEKGTIGDGPIYPTFSTDSKQLTYLWCRGAAGCELRLINLQDRGIPRYRKLADGISTIFSWTADGKSIPATRVSPPNSRDIGLLSVADGSFRPLKTVLTPGLGVLAISPDGKYLAFNHGQNTPNPRDLSSVVFPQLDISVLPVDGGPAIKVVEHPADDDLVGWSPDGKYLLFTSDRGTGAFSLYAQPMTNGRPQGAVPQLIERDMGHPQTRGSVTSSGALYYQPQPANNVAEIQVGTFDFASGTLGPFTVVGAEKAGSNFAPAWSPNGKQLAYLSQRGEIGSDQDLLVILAIDSGERRELRTGTSVSRLAWSPDGRSLLTSALASGIQRIDAQTGEISVIETGSRPARDPTASPDGASLYYRQDARNPTSVAFFVRDLASGSEREIIRRPILGVLYLSPDGRYIATGSRDAATNTRTFLLIPTGGGEPRELKRFEIGQSVVSGLMWAPDSRSFLVVAGEQREVWSLPTQGEPRRLFNDTESRLPASEIAVHPDGKRIAVSQKSPNRPLEEGVWVLENFLPRAASPAK